MIFGLRERKGNALTQIIIAWSKVDIEASPEVANAENVCIVPTFKIYKNGNRIKELVCPSRDVLEQSIRHYNLQSHDWTY